MSKAYSLMWLDKLVTETLNPEKSGPTILTPDEAAKIQSRVMAEKDKIQSYIIDTVFRLNEDAKIRSAVNKYYFCLNSLMYKTVNQSLILDNSPLQQISDTAMSCMGEVLSLIEERCDLYLNKEQRVSVTCLESVKKELNNQLSVVEKKLQGHEDSQLVFKILNREWVTFFEQSYDNHICTFVEISYLKDLCLELERFEPAAGIAGFCGLDELLIHVNFNAQTYISNLKQRLDAHINAAEPGNEQMNRLLYCRKLFEQFPQKREMIFNSQEVVLYKQVSDWFTQEEHYLEKKIHYSTILSKEALPLSKEDNDKEAAAAKKERKKKKEKISFKYSVDQLALIVKILFTLKIINAQSLNSLFKIIASYLSTPEQENISAESMRTKSYSPEEPDKKIVREDLQKMQKMLEI